MSLGPLTEDRLLGGRVVMRQPASGYRAATDPVLLAACVAARPGMRVLDAGCGAGAADRFTSPVSSASTPSSLR